MEVEDIIQQKEWQQTTNDERALLQPLATNEAEFNLLKKMLQISTADSFDVPAINPQVKHFLQDAMSEKANKKLARFKWQYAAAAMLFIGIGVWFFTTKNTASIAPTVAPIAKNTPIIEQIEKQIDTITENKTVVVLKDSNEKNIAIAPIKTQIQKTKSVITTQYDDYITSISSDTTLLAYITEVY